MTGSDTDTDTDTGHPLEAGTEVVYDPPSAHLEHREGMIDSLEDDDWGTLYVVADSEDDFEISIGESSIVTTLETRTEGGRNAQ